MLQFNELSILVVDDLSSARRVVRRMLEKSGVSEIIEAGSPNEAISILETQTLSLVISDLHLGDSSATLILDWINNNQSTEERTPTILITSDMDKEEFYKLKDLGIASYLLKPFSRTELIEHIELVTELGSSRNGEH